MFDTINSTGNYSKRVRRLGEFHPELAKIMTPDGQDIDDPLYGNKGGVTEKVSPSSEHIFPYNIACLSDWQAAQYQPHTWHCSIAHTSIIVNVKYVPSLGLHCVSCMIRRTQGTFTLSKCVASLGICCSIVSGSACNAANVGFQGREHSLETVLQMGFREGEEYLSCTARDDNLKIAC